MDRLTVKQGQISKVISRMNKRPFIRGISGIMHLGVIERRRGSLDAQQNQLCIGDDQILTPNVIRMHGCLDVYMNKMYSYAVDKMRAMYEELSGLFTELERIKSQAVIEVLATGEEGQRQQEAVLAKRKKDLDRVDEIKQRTAEIKESLSTADETVKHHMEQAEEIVRSHISVYWSGVLRNSEDKLPAYPVVNIKECKGIGEYENHICQIGAMVDSILSD